MCLTYRVHSVLSSDIYKKIIPFCRIEFNFSNVQGNLFSPQVSLKEDVDKSLLGQWP
jgi:hypothetical protein